MSQKELFNKMELPITDEINSVFEINHFSIGKVKYGGDILVGIVKFKDDAILITHWKEFNSYLTAKFMPTVTDDYSKWNFYVFYIAESSLGKSIKYEIENNKFSSRKIVIEDCKNISKEVIEEIISEHITNDNFQTNVIVKQKSSFKKNANLVNILDKISLKDDLQEALNSIEKAYKNEV